MLALTRTQFPMASSAASRAVRHQSNILPSGAGSLTGQKNKVPCRLIAKNNVLVTNSPLSSGTRPAVTMYSSRSSFSSMIGKLSRYSGLGWTRTKSCGLGLRTGTVVSSFFTPAVSTNDWLSRRLPGSTGAGGAPVELGAGFTVWRAGLVMLHLYLLLVESSWHRSHAALISLGTTSRSGRRGAGAVNRETGPRAGTLPESAAAMFGTSHVQGPARRGPGRSSHAPASTFVADVLRALDCNTARPATASGESGLGVLDLGKLGTGRALPSVLPNEIALGADTHQCSPKPHFDPAASSFPHVKLFAARDVVPRAKFFDGE